MSDSCTKADEYASSDKDGFFKMLLVRCTLGDAYVSSKETDDIKGCPQGKHSVIGDRETLNGTFKECVVYDSAQTYPAYIIRYKRIFH